MFNNDPTREQMRLYLQTEVPEVDEHAIEAAIYWYALDYYEGQSSNLYAALCSSPFIPSILHTSIEEEGETAAMLYAMLEHGF